jgi:hypothetical protein
MALFVSVPTSWNSIAHYWIVAVLTAVSHILNGGILNFECTPPILNKLNENIHSVSTDSCFTGLGINAMNIVSWKMPIQLSIGDLPPESLRQMIVTPHRIVGFNVIRKHTVILSTKNGMTDIRIFPGKLSQPGGAATSLSSKFLDMMSW